MVFVDPQIVNFNAVKVPALLLQLWFKLASALCALECNVISKIGFFLPWQVRVQTKYSKLYESGP